MLMHKILKGIAIGVGGLVVLIGIAAGAIYTVSEMRMHATYNVPIQPVQVPTDAAAIAEGERQYSIRACGDCHGKDLSGVTIIDDVPGRITGANLTRGNGGIGNRFKDEDYVRAIRHGVAPDGRPLLIMPAGDYRNMSETDLGNLLAYIKSRPAVDHVTPPNQVSLLFRAIYLFGGLPLLQAETIDHNAPIQAPKPALTVAYGRYMAQTCTGCHTQTFAGGPLPGAGPDTPPAANLTPAGNLSVWTESDFIKIIRTGMRPNGRPINPEHMPWPSFAHMSDTELKAIYMYLKTVPAAQPKQ